MGVPVLERRSAVARSRGDALALLGMGKAMFDTVPAIRDSQSYDEMADAMLVLSERKLDKKHACYAAQHELQLRVRTFITTHDIK